MDLNDVNILYRKLYIFLPEDLILPRVIANFNSVHSSLKYKIAVTETIEYQFQLGAIGRRIQQIKRKEGDSFNSSLVRLGALRSWKTRLLNLFQFQLGAIGRSSGFA